MKIFSQHEKVIVATVLLAASTAHSSIVLYDFESQNLNGWTKTGDAWDVGGSTGTIPNISPAEGNNFARSGAPNVASGNLAETKTGTIMSGAHQLTYDTLEWLSTGWSGLTYSGVNKFEILDSSLTVKAQIATAQSDQWETESIDMLGLGFSAGDTFYFKATDEANALNYSWMAFDKLTLTGSAIPEPATLSFVVIFGGGTLFIRRRLLL